MFYIIEITNKPFLVRKLTSVTQLNEGLSKLATYTTDVSVKNHAKLDDVIVSILTGHNTVLYLIKADTDEDAIKIAALSYNEELYLTMNYLETVIKAKTLNGVIIYIEHDTETLVEPMFVGQKKKSVDASMIKEIIETDVPFAEAVNDLRKMCTV